MLETEALQIDETPGSYLAPGTGKSQTGYWWAYRDIHTSTVYFDWHTSRDMDCLLDMLGFDEESKTLLFTGHIQCDGYKAYDAPVKQFEGIVLAGCMALACSPKLEPSVMRVPGASRVYDSHEKKKTYPRTDRQKTSRCP